MTKQTGKLCRVGGGQALPSYGTLGRSVMRSAGGKGAGLTIDSAYAQSEIALGAASESAPSFCFFRLSWFG